MAVTDTNTMAGPFIGDGSAVVFPFTFAALSADEVSVVVDDATLPVGSYAVDLDNKAVVLSVPLSLGARLFIISDPSFEQQIQFENGSRWLADPVNEANDRAAIRAIWLRDRVARAPLAPLQPEDAAGLFPTIGGDGQWVFTPAGPGATGSSDNTYSSLSAFKASDISRLTASLVAAPGMADGRFNWTLGNFAGKADDQNIVKSDSASLSVGAWVRQQADGVAFKSLGATYLPVSSKLASGEVSITDGFGITMADANFVNDVTAAVQLAVDALADAGGGTLRFPRGAWRMDTVSRNFNDGRGVSIRGEGKRATRIKKLTKNNMPVFDWSAPLNVLETYSDFSDFWLEGYDTDALGDGIRLTRCARFNIENVDIRICNAAIRSIGSLVFNIIACTVQNNVFGLRTSASADVPMIYSNAINISDSTFALNTQLAFDLDSASGFHVRGCDIEGNGTPGNVNTGAFRFRASDDDEAGTAFSSITQTWLEGNFGTGILVEPGMGSQFGLAMHDLQLLAQEDGQCALIESGMVSATNVRSVGASDEWIMHAAAETWIGSNVAKITTTTPQHSRLYINHNGAVNGTTFGIGTDGGMSDVTISQGRSLLLRAANGALQHRLGIDGTTGRMLAVPDAPGFEVSGAFYSTLPTHADDAAAGAAGLTAGRFYRTSAGDVKVKL